MHDDQEEGASLTVRHLLPGGSLAQADRTAAAAETPSGYRCAAVGRTPRQAVSLSSFGTGKFAILPA